MQTHVYNYIAVQSLNHLYLSVRRHTTDSVTVKRCLQVTNQIVNFDAMASGVPTPDVLKSTVSLSATNSKVGSKVEVHLTLRGSRGNPMVGAGLMSSVDAIVQLPNGNTERIEFPDAIPAGGVCKALLWLKNVGVHQVCVKICGVEVKGSPVKVVAGIRGNLLNTYKPPMNQPHDIIQRENIFVVTDKSNNQVQVFDKNSVLPTSSVRLKIATWASLILMPLPGRGKPSRVQELCPVSSVRRETLQQPCGIAAGKDGSVYVADGQKHCIFVFDKHRECTSIIGGQGSALGQLNTPWFMAMNSRGNLVVAEFKNRRVQVFNPKRRQAVKIIDVKHNGKAWDCRGLALDQNDNVYVTVRSGFMRGWSVECVLVYAPNGDFLGNFGDGFNYVRGITVVAKGQSTIAYVVDGAHNRIVEYEM
ncbi:E3 ubiquitin-protein ligase TRIM71-like [Strongylocentrotus purpuratus]|uniref:Uncharacterized protein n=1 Tax=Strongylocentrotus purpuratus TaxID=7668 RepID=A0A7M7P136_STRPU|nr:E3 ubiquitin-protein ligase TRIM71-like [Strongylocentrotus purpuratus]